MDQSGYYCSSEMAEKYHSLYTHFVIKGLAYKDKFSSHGVKILFDRCSNVTKSPFCFEIIGDFHCTESIYIDVYRYVSSRPFPPS